MKKILFLGYSKKKTKIIDYVSTNKNYRIFNTKEKISLNKIKDIDLIISFGYRHLIDKDIIRKKRILNLHISYLPFNIGAHPNFWSFVENTPSGITINRINNGIDTGNIIYQKIIDFELNKNKKKLTFSNTYSVLKSEIEQLFFANIKNILNNDYDEYEQIGNGSFHNSNELPKILKSWDQNIFATVKKYQKIQNNFIKTKLIILNEIENTRKNNNINWMNILRNSLKNSTSETLKILKSINIDDDKISQLFKKLNEK